MSDQFFRAVLSCNEDECRTVVRVEEGEMQRLGIRPGDIVIVEGNQRTAAVCLPQDLERQEPGGADIKYLNSPGRPYPILLVTNTVHSGIRSHAMGSLVRLARLMAHEDMALASKVVLSTSATAEAAHGKGYEERIDFARCSGNVVSKGQQVAIRMAGPDRTGLFYSTVIDVLPQSGSGYWLVGPETVFELRQSEDPGSFVPRPLDPNRLVDLRRVVPVVKKTDLTEEVSLTLPFVEIYDSGSKLFFYLTERISRTETIDAGGIKITRPASKLSGIVFANMEISDDMGNTYMHAPGGSHGGSTTFPSTVPGWEFFNIHTVVYGFWPPIAGNARELKVLVREFVWQDMHPPSPFPAHTVPPPEKLGSTEPRETGIKEYQMRPMPAAKRQLCVLSGPWEFKVRVD